MLDGDNAPPGNVEEARPKKHPSQHGWANTTENIFRGRKRAPASSVVVDDVSKIAFSLRISRNGQGGFNRLAHFEEAKLLEQQPRTNADGPAALDSY